MQIYIEGEGGGVPKHVRLKHNAGPTLKERWKPVSSVILFCTIFVPIWRICVIAAVAVAAVVAAAAAAAVAVG